MKAGSEAAFQQQVQQLAAYYGWESYHTHDSRRSAPGFPDLVLVRGPELIFAELKTDKGRLRPDQARWIGALTVVHDAVYNASRGDQYGTGVAVDVYIWRPADFDEMHGRLARGRARTEPLYRSSAAASASPDPNTATDPTSAKEAA